MTNDLSSEERDSLKREIETLQDDLPKTETEKRRLAALVESSPVGLMVVDADTRTFASVNKEAERILGISPEPGFSLVRYHQVTVYRRMDGKKYENHERPLARALNGGEVVRAEEIVLNLPDGRSVTTLVNATPIYSDDGKIVSAVAVIEDLTPLEKMERLRNEFLAMVSHELRAPLTTIKGATATALSASSPHSSTEIRQFFRTIDEQTNVMSELVSNLLDATKIEAGALVVTPKKMDVAALVNEAVGTFKHGGTRNYVQVDLAPELPSVSADPSRVVQVLNNLLSNAEKFSFPSSNILVTASFMEPYVTVSVTDQGRGVSSEQLPELFKKFSKGVLAGDQGMEEAAETDSGVVDSGSSRLG